MEHVGYVVGSTVPITVMIYWIYRVCAAIGKKIQG